MAMNSASRTALLATALLAASVTSARAVPYSFAGQIAIPASPANPNPGGAFTSFDISFFDPTTGLDYVADRSNAGVDIFSGSSLSYVGRAGGFVGQQATTSVSGPDGVVVAIIAGIPTLFAGDGNSTLKSFNVMNPAAPSPGFTTPTGGSFRVDEMAYSPLTNQVLVANNADAPAFGSLINASTGAIVHGNIVIPGASPTDGLEQPVWNPTTKSFFISVPSFGGGTDPGGVAEINTDGTVGRLYKFAGLGISSCSPTGLALRASGNLLVGCGDAKSQTVVLNPTGSGSIVSTLSQIAGSDEVYFDPTTNNFFATGVDTGGNRVIDVISDLSGNSILQSILLPSTGNTHSVAVDPLNGDIFVPLPGGSAACALGCIAVYSVPEPATLPLLVTAAIVVGGLAIRRRRLPSE